MLRGVASCAFKAETNLAGQAAKKCAKSIGSEEGEEEEQQEEEEPQSPDRVVGIETLGTTQVLGSETEGGIEYIDALCHAPRGLLRRPSYKQTSPERGAAYICECLTCDRTYVVYVVDLSMGDLPASTLVRLSLAGRTCFMPSRGRQERRQHLRERLHGVPIHRQ